MRKYKHYAIGFIYYGSLLYSKRKKITDKNCFVVASHHFACVNYHFAGEI